MSEKFWKQHKYLKVIVMLLCFPIYLLLGLLISLYENITDKYYWKEMLQDFNNYKPKEK